MGADVSNRLPRRDRDRDHPMFANTSLECRMCGSLYDEDEPPVEEWKGYCSESCKRKSMMIDKAEDRHEEER